jgi:hypothetical protein
MTAKRAMHSVAVVAVVVAVVVVVAIQQKRMKLQMNHLNQNLQKKPQMVVSRLVVVANVVRAKKKIVQNKHVVLLVLKQRSSVDVKVAMQVAAVRQF